MKRILEDVSRGMKNKISHHVRRLTFEKLTRYVCQKAKEKREKEKK